ncbi:hypothetical protein, partial [Staphylococcus aureus]|uniref:hypothetical protein n=1 Tax=Staphylococcus aureus TaxID=1280 RepID=UPI001BFDE4D7
MKQHTVRKTGLKINDRKVETRVQDRGKIIKIKQKKRRRTKIKQSNRQCKNCKKEIQSSSPKIGTENKRKQSQSENIDRRTSAMG